MDVRIALQGCDLQLVPQFNECLAVFVDCDLVSGSLDTEESTVYFAASSAFPQTI